MLKEFLGKFFLSRESSNYVREVLLQFLSKNLSDIHSEKSSAISTRASSNNCSRPGHVSGQENGVFRNYSSGKYNDLSNNCGAASRCTSSQAVHFEASTLDPTQPLTVTPEEAPARPLSYKFPI